MIGTRILLLFTVIVWGWSFVATKICLQYMTPLELIGLRFLIALPLLALIIKIKKLSFRIKNKSRAIALGSLIIGLHFFIQVTGLQFTSATNTGWIISVTPLVMALGAVLILKEKLTRRTIISIIVATLGIFILVSNGKIESLDWLSSVGDWLVLISAHTWALYTIATRDLSRSSNPLTVTFSVLFPAFIVVMAIISFTADWSKFLALPLEAVLALLFLGVAAMALAQWFWQIGIAKAGAAESGLFLYLEPVATTALAVPYLGESFTVYTALGGILVLFAVAYSQKSKLRQKK